MKHIESAHCPCGPKSEVVWPDGDLRDRVQDAIDHAGSESDTDDGVTPEILYHALNEAGLRLETRSAICGIVSNSGLFGEPLACAYSPGHDNDHSWATLPTFPSDAAWQSIRSVSEAWSRLRS